MTVSATMLLLLFPLMLVISVAIGFTMGTPVVFRQTRPGYRRKPFKVLKFRTMTLRTHNADGRMLSDRDRTPRLGKILRDTGLDELPQLVNIFMGDMSFVGPRPLLQKYIEDCTFEQMRRFDCLPGITGWAQVHGRKGLDYDSRFEYDIWYVDHQSLLLDLRIILATIKVLLVKDGTEEIEPVTIRPEMPVPALKVPIYASDSLSQNDGEDENEDDGFDGVREAMSAT